MNGVDADGDACAQSIEDARSGIHWTHAVLSKSALVTENAFERNTCGPHGQERREGGNILVIYVHEGGKTFGVLTFPEQTDTS